MSDDVMVAEKAGMLVGTDANGQPEIVGWVNKGDEYDLQEGDTLVTHHKTAEKLGLGDAFKEMKADNAQVKEKGEPKEKGERKPRQPKYEITPEMTYTVLKADFAAAGEEGERGEAYKILLANTSVAGFLENCKGYTATKKDGTNVTFSADACLRYAVKRGAISKPE
jgi:hypothetical protein